ncbi:MAG TPA: hypothetical protein PKL84_03675 [Candidatus Hydrogenedentes bacterium]|nr:hypothetical protein [Candidatus Hydrogenedentota bacterium]
MRAIEAIMGQGKNMGDIKPEHACYDLPPKKRTPKYLTREFFQLPRVEAMLNTLISVIKEIDQWHLEHTPNEENPRGIHCKQLEDLIKQIRRIRSHAGRN